MNVPLAANPLVGGTLELILKTNTENKYGKHFIIWRWFTSQLLH